MSRLLHFGLHESLLKKRHLCLLVQNPRRLEAQAWVENTDVVLKELHLRFQKKETRDDIKKRDDRSGEAPVDPDRPPSLIIGDQIERYNNITVTKSFLGPFDLATGVEIPLREDHATSIYQKAIPFPGGKRMYPAHLVCPSTTERANMEPLVMAFDLSGMIAQLPMTLSNENRQSIVDELKLIDLRHKPSSLPAVIRLKKASKTTDTEVSVVDVVVVLAHAHWQIFKDDSSYGFIHTHFRELGITDVLNYKFDWSRTDGTNVLDGQGNKLRIYDGLPPTGRKFSPRFKKRFEDTRDGKRLRGEKVYTFHGRSTDGKLLYRTHYDLFKCTEAQMEDLLGQQASITAIRAAMGAHARCEYVYG